MSLRKDDWQVGNEFYDVVHLPEPVVDPVRPWCGAQPADGKTPTTLMPNTIEYLRQHATCRECIALDERTRHHELLPRTAETLLHDPQIEQARRDYDRASARLRERVQQGATLAINAVYGTDDRHAYMALRIAQFAVDGTPLPWRYPPGTGDDPDVDHRPTTPVQCSCGWRETDDQGERTWAEHMAATLRDPDAPPLHYNPATGETSDLR